MTYQRLYNETYFNRSRKFQTAGKRLDELTKIVVEEDCETILDVGCGRGYLVERLNGIGMKAIGVDFSEYATTAKVCKPVILADAKELPFPDKMFDLVVSTDFFEHIPEKDTEEVYLEMQRVGKRVVAKICFSGKQNYHHINVKPKVWWEIKYPNLNFL